MKIVFRLFGAAWKITFFISIVVIHDLIIDEFYSNFIASSSWIPCLNTQRRLQNFFVSYTSFISHVMAFMWLYWCKEFISCDEAAATIGRMTKDKDNELCMFHPNSIFFIEFSVKVKNEICFCHQTTSINLRAIIHAINFCCVT